MKFIVGSKDPKVKELIGTAVLHHQNQVNPADLEAKGKPLVLLIDSDIVAYRCSATTDGRVYLLPDGSTTAYKKDAIARCEARGLDKEAIKQDFKPEPPESANLNVRKLLRTFKGIFSTPVKMEHYLTPKVVFRNDLESGYKQNRKNMRRPANLGSTKLYLQQEHGATVVEGYEADDLIGIRAVSLMKDDDIIPIIVTLDKDLDTIPGYHYNWTKGCLYYITDNEARLCLYKQMLTGDKVDNIPGLNKVGPKTADRIMKEFDGSDEYAMYNTVLAEYLNRTERIEGETEEEFISRVIKRLSTTARLLYILHEPGEVWVPPVQVTPETEEAKQ